MDIIYAKGENYQAKFNKELNNGGKINACLNYHDVAYLMNNDELRANPVTVNMLMMGNPMPMIRYTLTDVKSLRVIILIMQSMIGNLALMATKQIITPLFIT